MIKLRLSIARFWIELKRNAFCRFFHYKHRCYPDVEFGTDVWHCSKCLPCGRELDLIRYISGRISRRHYWLIRLSDKLNNKRIYYINKSIETEGQMNSLDEKIREMENEV